jgi:ADP-ribosylglycohydrolase
LKPSNFCRPPAMLEQVESSTSDHAVGRRKIGAVVGSLVADAATMGLHWIYNTQRIKEIVGEGHPEFFIPPSCPFYSYESGRNTPYGEQALHLLEFLAAHEKFDPEQYSKLAYEYFNGPYTGRLDHSLKGFIENMKNGRNWPQCGSNDDQANGLAKIAPVVALYAGKPELLARAEEAIRVTQNTDKAVAAGLAGARILEKIILGSSPREAIQATLQELRDDKRHNPNSADSLVADAIEMALSLADQTHAAAVARIGSSCAFPLSLQNAVHLLVTETDFVRGVRASMLAGGDNASRLLFAGACLGALNPDAIPEEWKKKANAYNSIIDFAAKL